MVLRILTSESLSLLKDRSCIASCLNKYKNYDNSDWLYDICGDKPFINTKHDNVPDIVFDMSAPKGKEYETEFENVKRVYSALGFLSDSNASDERLWAALCLDIGYSYVQYRWNLQTPDNILQHFYFERGNRRSLTRNALARLWWIGRLTYDKDRTDPFELTRLVCSHSDYIMHFIERNTSNNLHVLRPFLEAIIEANSNGYDINTDDAGELAKYLNLLGGMYILDFMPESWIKEKVSLKIEEIINRSMTDISTEDEKTTKIKVDNNSKVLIKADDMGVVLTIMAKKNKFNTVPESLIGLTVGDEIRIGKSIFHIIDIK